MTSLEHRIAKIEAQLGQIATERDKYRDERDEYRKLYNLLREENEKLRVGLLGQKAEKKPSEIRQLTLDVLATALTAKELQEEAKQEVKEHKRKKPTGRKPLPEDLPLVEIDLVPDEVKRLGEDAFKRIGEEVSEVLERRPASMVRVRVIRGKYVLKDTKRNTPAQVHTHQPLELPIEKGLAGPGMLADTIVRRWEDHCPLKRLESIYARDKVPLARATICNWHEQLVDLTRPLIKAMYNDALKQPYLCCDATGVLVQAKVKCKKTHFWVLVAPKLHVLFRHSDKHDSQAVDALLKGYKGYLVADAHSVFDHLFTNGDVVECGCWCHCRRYFYKALSSDPDTARVGLAFIAALFKIERSIANSPKKKREQQRHKKSRPIVEEFFEWCDAESVSALDDTPISKAFGYASNQKQALSQFLEDGRLPMHNNVSERELRRQAVGRKNWLFIGSKDGAEANTTFVTLLASCKLHQVEPWAYLRDLLCLLPSWPVHRVLELAPAYWKDCLKNEDTQRLLAANRFREITLSID